MESRKVPSIKHFASNLAKVPSISSSTPTTCALTRSPVQAGWAADSFQSLNKTKIFKDYQSKIYLQPSWVSLVPESEHRAPIFPSWTKNIIVEKITMIRSDQISILVIDNVDSTSSWRKNITINDIILVIFTWQIQVPGLTHCPLSPQPAGQIGLRQRLVGDFTWWLSVVLVCCFSWWLIIFILSIWIREKTFQPGQHWLPPLLRQTLGPPGGKN